MRASILRTVAVAGFLGIAVPAAAQTVEEVIAMNLAAKGGVELLKQTTSVRTVAKASTQNGEVTITSMSKRPNLMRNEISGPGQNIVFGFDGNTAWVAPQGMPAKAMPGGPQTDAMKQTSQIDSPLLDHEARGMKVELAGTESEGQRRLHHLILRPKSGQAMHYYVDAATGLESRIMVEGNQDGTPVRTEVRFSDYRSVEGRMVPFTTTQVVNGNEIGQVKYQKVEFNVPLEDALFRMPR